MEAQALVSQTKQILARIQSKGFKKFPTVKRFLERIKAVDGKYVFQDVILTHSEQGRDTFPTLKQYRVGSKMILHQQANSVR